VTRGTRHPAGGGSRLHRRRAARDDRKARPPTRGALPRACAGRALPALPHIHELTLGGRPRPVTPYYVMLSTTLQPELSAALVGVKTPAQSVADARRRLEFLLAGARG
jgi:multiple sugar transport system substrate-binding protein